MIRSIPQIIILVFSIVFHEVAHGRVALWRGDTTARDAGRLTLNPLPHIDIFGTILFPLLLIITNSPVLFGWAKPVPVNPFRFKEIKKDMALVGASGPASNLFLAVVIGILFRISNSMLGTDHAMTYALSYGVYINLVLTFFNLIPIPPLDGSRIVMAFLPENLAIQYSRIERYGFIIIFTLLFLGFYQHVLFRIVSFFLFLIGGSSIFAVLSGS
jgi:Zn-dependent protease